jgi:hypothetical protein
VPAERLGDRFADLSARSARYQREHRAAEPAAHHPRAERSRGQRGVDRRVRLRPGDLEVIPQREVRRGEQPPDVPVSART